MILVDKDIPKCCDDCPCFDEEIYFCNASNRGYDHTNPNALSEEPWLDKVHTWETRADWCPLKEVVPCKDCKHWVESKKRPGIGICHYDSADGDDTLWTSRDWWCKGSKHEPKV